MRHDSQNCIHCKRNGPDVCFRERQAIGEVDAVLGTSEDSLQVQQEAAEEKAIKELIEAGLASLPEHLRNEATLALLNVCATMTFVMSKQLIDYMHANFETSREADRKWIKRLREGIAAAKVNEPQ